MPRHPPKLPLEILLHILSYLPRIELMWIRMVNRLFCDLAMDHLRLYEHCVFPFNRDSPESASELLQARDPSLAKRIKSVDISTLPLFEIPRASRVSRIPAASTKQETEVTVVRRSLFWSMLLKCITGARFRSTRETEVAPHVILPKSTADRVLDALSRAENLQKATIRLTWHGNFDLELNFSRSLSSILSARTSISDLELIVHPNKLESVLPIMQFRGLKDVSLHLDDMMSNEDTLSADALRQFVKHLTPSMDALRQFLKYLAPALEVLSIIPNRYDVASLVSDVLLETDTSMPKLQELTFYATIYNPGMFKAIGLNYPALTKLRLWPTTITAYPLSSLGPLRLPALRTLEIWFQEPNTIPGPGFWGLWSQTSITCLLLKVDILDGHLIDVLAASFPALRDLTLYVRNVIRPGLGRGAHALIRDEMKDRCYPDWGLTKFSLSLSEGKYSIEAIISVLSVSMPHVEFNNLGHNL